MSDQDKDLTSIADLSKKTPVNITSEGAAPAMEEVPVETVENFESLEEYSQSQPATIPPEPPTAASVEIDSTLPPPPTMIGELPSDLTFAPEPDPTPAAQAPLDEPPPVVFEAEPFTEPVTEPSFKPLPTLEPRPQAKPGLDSLKEYSEHAMIGKPEVSAQYPFSLLIEGHLEPTDRERLLDFISRENIGIREIDLEPQFEANRILIPRVSEFAGILIAQALRDAGVSLRLGPSDTIFSAQSTRDDAPDELISSDPAPRLNRVIIDDADIDSIPLIAGSGLSIGDTEWEAIDAVSASAMLQANSVEAKQSSEYMEIIEGLERELKFRARRRGASAVIHFKIELTPLHLPSQYRVTAIGTAVKRKSQL